MIKLKDILLEAATGDCYQAAGRLMTTLSDDHTLVHGMVDGQGALQGKRFGHAWVETNDTVLDHSNGRKLEIPKAVYYSLGNIKQQDNKYYDKNQALTWIVKAKHWGPWEMSGDTIDISEEIPDQEQEIGKQNIPIDSKDTIKLKHILSREK